MTVRKRGEHWSYEFWVKGERYSGTSNGKDGKPIVTNKREAKIHEAVELSKVLDGTYQSEHDREELKDFPHSWTKSICLSQTRITAAMAMISIVLTY